MSDAGDQITNLFYEAFDYDNMLRWEEIAERYAPPGSEDAPFVWTHPRGVVTRTWNGVFHCKDKAAIVSADGKWECWCKEGDTHRIDGPAIIAPYTLRWYVDGKPHRVDGPSSVYEMSPWGQLPRMWCVWGKDITADVEQWIIDCNKPSNSSKWNQNDWQHWRLAFVGDH